MSPDVIKFIPVGTLLVLLVAGFMLDPTSTRPVMWAIPIGLLLGLLIQFGVRQMKKGGEK